MKFCKNCKFYQLHCDAYAVTIKYACTNEKAQGLTPASRVTGEPPDCEKMREFGMPCGELGALYRPKDE